MATTVWYFNHSQSVMLLANLVLLLMETKGI